MNKQRLTLQTLKPLLVASALVLTACGGSGSGNAPLPEQPSTPQAPDNGKKPGDNHNAKEQKPNGNHGAQKPKPNDNGGAQKQKPDANGGKSPPPPRRNPNPAPKPAPELKEIDPANASGSGLIAYTRREAAPNEGGSPNFRQEKRLVENVFGGATQPFMVKKNSIILSKELLNQIDNSTTTEAELKFSTSQSTTTSGSIGITYKAGKFGYQNAQAFHYYGSVGTMPFNVAYSIGELTLPKTVQELQGAGGKIVYQGQTSFLANAATENSSLEYGKATITLNTGDKKLDAVIELPKNVNRYEFKDVSYKDAADFAHQDKDKAIRGYFYGDKAQHIGGTYYVPEGGGAFVTEKQ